MNFKAGDKVMTTESYLDDHQIAFEGTIEMIGEEFISVLLDGHKLIFIHAQLADEYLKPLN